MRQNQPSNFKSTNFGSDFARFDCLPRSEFKKKKFLSSFCYHLTNGAYEKCQKFLILVENLPSNLKSTNFGSVFARFDCLPTSEIILNNFF